MCVYPTTITIIRLQQRLCQQYTATHLCQGQVIRHIWAPASLEHVDSASYLVLLTLIVAQHKAQRVSSCHIHASR